MAETLLTGSLTSGGSSDAGGAFAFCKSLTITPTTYEQSIKEDDGSTTKWYGCVQVYQFPDGFSPTSAIVYHYTAYSPWLLKPYLYTSNMQAEIFNGGAYDSNNSWYVVGIDSTSFGIKLTRCVSKNPITRVVYAFFFR